MTSFGSVSHTAGVWAPTGPSDSTPNSAIGAVGSMGFNGTNWERETHNLELTVIASAARTATNNSADISNFNCRGAHIVVDVTAAAIGASVVFAVQGKDAVSGKYFTLLTALAVTGTGTTALAVYPGITAANNVAASQVLSRYFRVTATHATADSITYSVGAVLIR